MTKMCHVKFLSFIVFVPSVVKLSQRTCSDGSGWGLQTFLICWCPQLVHKVK